MPTPKLKTIYRAAIAAAILSQAPAALAQSCTSLNTNFTLYFESESAVLTEQAKAVVNQAMDNIVHGSQSFGEDECSFSPIQIIGHTDSKGSEARNQALSEAMAHSVADYFAERHGMTSEYLDISAKGETNLAKTTRDNVREPLNRRVTVAFIFDDN